MELRGFVTCCFVALWDGARSVLITAVIVYGTSDGRDCGMRSSLSAQQQHTHLLSEYEERLHDGYTRRYASGESASTAKYRALQPKTTSDNALRKSEVPPS